MKLNRLNVLTIVALLYITLFAVDAVSDGTSLPPEFVANLPPWESVEPRPKPVFKNAPVYLDVDSDGNVYRLNAVYGESGTYEFSYELMTQIMVDEIRGTRKVILQDVENIHLPPGLVRKIPLSGRSAICTLPERWSIVSNSNGEAVGSVKVANTNRSAEATTQWIVFDFFTRNYRDRAAHMPIALFHDETMHGWGSFIGDNHGSYRWDGTYAGCGDTAQFNSQVEGWIQLPHETPPTETSEYWQNYVFNGSDSCGNEMYDGPVVIVPGYIHVPRYRMEMQTSTGHWVAYRIWEYVQPPGSSVVDPENWEILTDWKVTDVDAGNWEHYPLNWLTDTQGIFIFSTNTKTSDQWEIQAYETQCGWF